MAYKYEQVYADHQYLWGISAASDMTGGYQDSDDLDELLKKPTKATARACLLRQIQYWFQVGPEDAGFASCPATPEEMLEEYPKVGEIAERYGHDPYFWKDRLRG